MPQSGTKDCNISYQMSQQSTPIYQLVNDYGDRLEKLTAVEKTAVWAVLAFWQAVDTELECSYVDESEDSDRPNKRNWEPIEADETESYTLDDAIRDYGADLPSEAEEILNRLCGISDETCFDLMVAISHQLRAGIFAEDEK